MATRVSIKKAGLGIAAGAALALSAFGVTAANAATVEAPQVAAASVGETVTLNGSDYRVDATFESYAAAQAYLSGLSNAEQYTRHIGELDGQTVVFESLTPADELPAWFL